MSTLKADTIQNTSGGAATLTKQEASKFWAAIDTVNDDVEGSLNASSYTDEATGRGTIAITNAFSSQHDRCILSAVYNSYNDGTQAIAGATRAMMNINIGAETSANIDPLSASSIQLATCYGSTGSANGAANDVSKAWLSAMGDLA